MVHTHTIIGIQYLRGFAALMVLWFHVCAHYHKDFHIGQAGVDIFFIISGFMMWFTTYGSEVTVTSFVLKRLRRLVPLYWIVTLATIIVAHAIPESYSGIRMGTEEMFKSLFFIPYRNLNNPGWPIVLQGWTLNIEMLFYLIFALAVSKRPWQRLLIPTIILTSLVVIRAIFHPSSAYALWTSPMLLELLAGLWIGFAFTSGWLHHSSAGLALIVASVIIFTFCQWYGVPADRLRLIYFGIPALALVTGCLMVERNKDIPKIAALLFLGDASYSIYLWHTLTIVIVDAMERRLGMSDGIMAVPLLVVVLLLASLLGYVLIERPLLAKIPRPRVHH